MLRLLNVAALLVLVPVLVLGQALIFNDMDDDPYWGGQLDREDMVEEKAIISYVSEPAIEGDGAMWIDWGITNNQDWGGNCSIGHSHLDPEGVYDWSDYDSLIIYFSNEIPSSMAGVTHMRLCLADVSDSENGPDVDSFSEAEYWYTFNYILDDAPGWQKLAFPLVDYRYDPDGNGFDRKGWYGIDGNDELDLDMIKGFNMEFVIGASEGDIATGAIVLDNIILTTVGGDTAVFCDLDEDPYWNGQRDRYDEVETNVVLSYVSDPVMVGEGAMWLDWGVTNDQSWGGGSFLNHTHYDSLGVYDWAEYDTIAFWYYNFEPSSMPGTVHLRFNLGDVSDSENGPNVTSFGDMEYYYSFLYILDDEPGWNKIAMPLADKRDDPNGFEQTGWYGIEGNNMFDPDMIKGFQFEFSMSASEGDIAMGSIVLDHLVLYTGEYNTDVEEIALVQPHRYALYQNFPNPFNASTTIAYHIPTRSHVEMKLYNVLGRELMTLVDQQKNAGRHLLRFDASALPSGVYFYQINADAFYQKQKMILMK